ncbi:hypothetical protein BDZ89DRAFT_1162271 [Hymenopellis radicata]|nr:hypothetical protein BDZ89DRAFT_1162271 [Hymenopellis radicata]
MALQATLHSMERERDALEAVYKQYRNVIHPRRFTLVGYLSARHSWGGQGFQCLRPIWPYLGIEPVVAWMPSPNEAPILQVVLQRTGQHPLELTLYNAGSLHRARRSSDVHDLWSSKDGVLGMILAESHRWRSVKILGYQEDSDILYAPLSGRLPQLESLSLHFPYEQPPVAEAQPVIIAFRDCPRLTKVFITGKRRPIDLPYASITELHIEDYANPLLHEDCWPSIRLVGQCTSLEKLRVTGCRDPDHSSLSAPLIPPLMIHSNLHKLATGCNHLIDHLTLPQLEEAVLSKELDPLYANILTE